MRARSRVLWLTVLLLFALLFFAPPPTLAQEKSLRWHRWDSSIQINTDGTFTVREELEIEFIGGPFTFGFRNISSDQLEDIRDIRVYEGGTVYSETYSSSPNTFYVERSSSEYVINWFFPSTTNQTRTFTLEYVVAGALLIDEPGDILNWQVVGEDHAYPIESSLVTITMPSGALIDTSDGPVSRGTDAEMSISSDKRSVTFRATNIPANRPLEVYIRFTHGVIPSQKPSWQESYEWRETTGTALNFVAGAIGFLVLAGGLAGVYLLWFTRGRDPKIPPAPSYLAEPPSDLPPGLAGTLVDEKADLQDIIATMVDLARRGFITMEEKQSKLFGITLQHDFVYRRVQDAGDPPRAYERDLLKEMFGSKDEIELDDLRNKFYQAIPRLQKAIYQEAVQEKLFPSNPQAVRGRYVALGVGGLVLAFGLGFCSLAGLAERVAAIICPFISLGLVSVVLLAVSSAMPTKSRTGAEEAAKWRAFKEYLRNAERYSDLEGMTDKFDRYLPYAIAFGLERSWINKFSQIPSTPVPPWYIPYGYGYPLGRAVGAPAGGMGSMTAAGPSGRDLRAEQVRPGMSLDSMSEGAFRGLSSMSDGLFSMLNTTSRVFTSVPQSSGSGGSSFSGGGFSGGGFSSGGSGGAGFG